MAKARSVSSGATTATMPTPMLKVFSISARETRPRWAIIAKTGAGGLELSGLGCGFRSGFSLLAARGFFLARLLQRDLLLDGLLLTRRFLISPVLAGRPAIGGPPRGGPVQR